MREDISKVLENVGKVIIGKEEVLEKLLAGLLAGGHVLLEDVPGTGKTKMAKALSASLGVDFGRIQFTPDMLPADITGMHIYRPKDRTCACACLGIILFEETVRRTGSHSGTVSPADR